MLECVKCGYSWFPRMKDTPKACPACRSRNWNGPAKKSGVYCPECPHCNPKVRTTEEQTALDRFNAIVIPEEPELTTCPKCGFVWKPRTDTPKQCPKCKARLDAGAGGKANAARAARAIAALGPLAETGPNDAGFSWMVCDWDGRCIGWTKTDLITREGFNRNEHYPVVDGETGLYGWVRRDAAFTKNGGGN